MNLPASSALSKAHKSLVVTTSISLRCPEPLWSFFCLLPVTCRVAGICSRYRGKFSALQKGSSLNSVPRPWHGLWRGVRVLHLSLLSDTCPIPDLSLAPVLWVYVDNFAVLGHVKAASAEHSTHSDGLKNHAEKSWFRKLWQSALYALLGSSHLVSLSVLVGHFTCRPPFHQSSVLKANRFRCFGAISVFHGPVRLASLTPRREAVVPHALSSTLRGRDRWRFKKKGVELSLRMLARNQIVVATQAIRRTHNVEQAFEVQRLGENVNLQGHIPVVPVACGTLNGGQ